MRSITFYLLGVFSFVMVASCSQFQKSEAYKGFVVTIPQRCDWNNNVTVEVQATPGTICKLSFINPAGDMIGAEGLRQTIAKANGNCSWTWKIDEMNHRSSGRLIILVTK